MVTIVKVNGFTHILDNQTPKYMEPYICIVTDSSGVKLISGVRLDSGNSDYSKCIRIIESNDISLVNECGIKFLSV